MAGREPLGQTESSGLILGKATVFQHSTWRLCPLQGPSWFLAPGRSGARSYATGLSELGGARLSCLDHTMLAVPSLVILLVILPLFT